MNFNSKASARWPWILALACAFLVPACVSTVLVVPERDLARELDVQVAALKALAETHCREREASVARVQFHLKRAPADGEISMEAECDTAGPALRCTLSVPNTNAPNTNNQEYNCASIPP